MSDRSKKIYKLLNDFDARRSYIKATLGILVPSKIRALRLKSNMPRQSDLAAEARMHQSRISMFETPGEANVTLETLAKLAAAFKVGLKVEFVPFSSMLRWEHEYSQDTFDVTRIEDDAEFLGERSEEPLDSAAITSSAPVKAEIGKDTGAESGMAPRLLRADGEGNMTQLQAVAGS